MNKVTQVTRHITMEPTLGTMDGLSLERGMRQNEYSDAGDSTYHDGTNAGHDGRLVSGNGDETK